MVGGRWVQWPEKGDTVISVDCVIGSWADSDYFLAKESDPSHSMFFVIDRLTMPVTKQDHKKGKGPLIPSFSLFLVRPPFQQREMSKILAAHVFETLPEPDKCVFRHGENCKLYCKETAIPKIRKTLMPVKPVSPPPSPQLSLPSPPPSPVALTQEEPQSPIPISLVPEVQSPVLEPEVDVEQVAAQLRSKETKHRYRSRSPSPTGLVSRSRSRSPPSSPILSQVYDHYTFTNPPRVLSPLRVPSPPTPPTPESVEKLHTMAVDWEFPSNHMASSMKPLEISFLHPDCKAEGGCGDEYEISEQLEKMLECLPVEKRSAYEHFCVHYLIDSMFQ